MEPIAANVLYEKVKGFVCNGNAYSENYLGVFRLARFYSHSLDAVSLARSACEYTLLSPLASIRMFDLL